ncbi:unnamed protein product [Rhizopus stolonifer]
MNSNDNSLVEGMHHLQTQDSDDDDQPLSSPQRPNNFIKPLPPQSNPPTASGDLRVAQTLYERYSQKIYWQGYVDKRNDLTVEGKECQDPWSRWYMELCGPSLSLWPDVKDQVTGQCVAILEAKVQPFVQEGEDVFSLNSAGSNRFLFRTRDMDQWMEAIKLSCYESKLIQAILTYKVIAAQTDLLSKPVTKMEGEVQVRFEKQGWEKYWTTVSDKSKKMFGKKSTAAKISFYESKKAKTAVKTIASVSHIHVVYPEPPQSIDSATVFKIMGHNAEEAEEAVTCFVMVPARELAPWIVSILDTFKLNGRPLHLLNDPANPQSLNFAETANDPNLFLSLNEALTADQGYTELLQEKIKNQKQRMSMRPQMGLIHQIPGGPQMTQRYQRTSQQSQNLPPQQQQQQLNVPNGITQKSGSSNVSLNAPSLNTSSLKTPSLKTPSINSRRMTYASDEEEEEEEEEEESDSDESVNKVHTTQDSLPTLSTTEEGSFRNSILQDIENKNPSQTSVKGKQPEQVSLPRPKTTQISDSEDEEDDEDDEEEEGEYSESDDDDVPIHQSRQTMYNQQMNQPMNQAMYNNNNNHQPMYNDQYMYEGQYYDDGYPATEDGPVIPQLGDHFATQNSLLDTFKPDYPSARDQEGYARATGQPLIQVPNKPPEPRSGLVGMISQIEHEKKQKEANKGRLLDKERILERERERYMMEQRAQQSMMQQPPMMGSGMMNQPMMNSMPMMQGGNGQMPMMGMMGQPMMYPMMNMPMMYPMMDPMSMMMMQQQQQQYGQFNPMWNQSQMFGSQYNGEEEDDEDDDVPLGAKETASNHKQ